MPVMVREERESTVDARAAALQRIATVRTEARIPDLVELLVAADAAPIVLKGPVTRSRLYPPGATRPTADIDLLVAPRAFGAASRALVAAGYVRVGRGGHSDTFGGPDGYVDLHLALPYTTVPPSRAFRKLGVRTTTMAVADRAIPVLDRPAHVVHLAMHAAQNGFDPDHRSLDEWRRGLATLSVRERATAELLVDELGAAQTWVLALVALERPEARQHVARALPVRKPEPSLSAVWAFLSSPIPVLVRARVLRAHVRRQLSDALVDSWRARRDLPPVAHGTPAAYRAKIGRLFAVTADAAIGRRS